MASTSADLFAFSAGLDAVAGVFGYLAAENARSVARSRADMIRAAAEANAQRYSEQAAAQNAQRKVMFLASGVTLAGSPIDVLDTQARVASENIASIRMGGEIDAFDEEQQGENAMVGGRNALLGGIAAGAGAAAKGAYASSLMKSPGDAGTPTATGFGDVSAKAFYAREFQ